LNQVKIETSLLKCWRTRTVALFWCS